MISSGAVGFTSNCAPGCKEFPIHWLLFFCIFVITGSLSHFLVAACVAIDSQLRYFFSTAALGRVSFSYSFSGSLRKRRERRRDGRRKRQERRRGGLGKRRDGHRGGPRSSWLVDSVFTLGHRRRFSIFSDFLFAFARATPSVKTYSASSQSARLGRGTAHQR